MKIDLKIKNKIKLDDLKIGTKKIPPVLQEKVTDPQTYQITITPDDNYNGLSNVVIHGVDYTIDNNIQSENIKEGISILGVNGSYAPSGITELNDCSYLFYKGSRWEEKDKLKTILDIRNASSMFGFIITNNQEIDRVVNLNDFDFSKATDMNSMLEYNQFGSPDNLQGLSGVDVSGLTNERGLDYFFRSFGMSIPLSKDEYMDMRNWNLSPNLHYLNNLFVQFCFNNNNIYDLEIDLRGWDINKIYYLGSTFSNSGFTKINLTDWNSESLRDSSYMFYNSNRLVEVLMPDMENLNGGAKISNMFGGCTSLRKIDIRKFPLINAREGSSYSGNVFTGVPNDCLIIVKDNDNKEWITSRYSNLTNVKTVAELEGE
ncbi:MAG: BspA family leucine-rich repeat surface protein [Bacilli bacterium]|nr:BspA family leucine-rich repeat surface protein [Bacilli bacterium]